MNSHSPSPPPHSAAPLQPVAEAKEIVHRTNVVQFLDRTTPIIQQNDNGPYPLLALSSTSAQNRARSHIDDPTSPYFLHPSNGSGLVLVSQLLNDNNYPSWSRMMLRSLTAMNKVGFIDGSIPMPSNDDPILVNSWIQNNGVVISWILNSVTEEIKASIRYSSSALEIWEDLRTRFQLSKGYRIFQLHRELRNLSQGQQTVGVYFIKLKSIWDELTSFRPACTCGKCTCSGVEKLNLYYQSEYVMSFLLGLNESLSQVRGQILLMDPLPSINKVLALVSCEEWQRSITTQSTLDVNNTLAFAARNDQFNCPNTGNEFYSNNFRKEKPLCAYCHNIGHTINRCYKLHGYPPGFRPKTRYSESSNPNINRISSAESVNTSGYSECGWRY